MGGVLNVLVFPGLWYLYMCVSGQSVVSEYQLSDFGLTEHSQFIELTFRTASQYILACTASTVSLTVDALLDTVILL